MEANLRLEEAAIDQLPGLALADQESPDLVPHLVKVQCDCRSCFAFPVTKLFARIFGSYSSIEL